MRALVFANDKRIQRNPKLLNELLKTLNLKRVAFVSDSTTLSDFDLNTEDTHRLIRKKFGVDTTGMNYLVDILDAIEG